MLNLHEPDDQRSSRLSAIGYRLSPIGYSFSPTARAVERIYSSSHRGWTSWDDRGTCGLKPSLSAWKPLRGWRFGYPCHIPGGPGLIQPAGLARPQPGLQPAKGEDGTLQKSSQGFNVSENCYKFSISISPTARAVERITAVLTKVEPVEQGW